MGIFKTPLEAVLIEEVIRIAKVCYNRGWCFGTAGNFSIRSKIDRMWQSPSARNKGNLQRDSFIPIQVDTGRALEDFITTKPSLEMPIHRHIYRARPGARAIVHCHPPFVVGLSDTWKGSFVRFGGVEMVKALGAPDYSDWVECPVIQNLSVKEMSHLSGLDQELRDAPALILRGHGVYAWGSDPDEALSALEAIEFIAQTLTHTSGLAVVENLR